MRYSVFLHQSQRYGESTDEEGIQVLKDNGVARIHFAHAKQNAFPATHLKAYVRL